jgi:hypothetical protein
MTRLSQTRRANAVAFLAILCAAMLVVALLVAHSAGLGIGGRA